MTWRKHRQPRRRVGRPAPKPSYTMQRYLRFLETHKPKYVIGIDEVAFGSFAGPLVVGAVVLPVEVTLPVQDSKRYARSASLRDAATLVHKEATEVFIYKVEAAQLDERGLGSALQEGFAVVAAWASEKYPDSVVVLDGKNLIRSFNEGIKQIALPKADTFVCAVSCASVCAKAEQLACMESLDEVYPEYGFYQHHGYGTASHRKAIEQHGVCPEHRTYISFIRKHLDKSS